MPFTATKIFPVKAPGGNSSFYLYHFTPTNGSLFIVIKELLIPFKAITNQYIVSLFLT
jgi:hypothetical protein